MNTKVAYALSEKASQEGRRQEERTKKILALFKPFINLKDVNGRAYKYEDGYWILWVHNCMLTYKTELCFVSEEFSETATEEDISKLMISMLVASKKKVEAVKEGVDIVDRTVAAELKRMKFKVQ